MRALICQAFDQPERLQVEERPDLIPGPGQVLIQVEAAGVNFPDALMVMGRYQVKPPLPFIPGAEAAGVITAVGEGVGQFQPGQRVAAFTGTGAFATQLLAPAGAVMPIPDAMPFEVAAILPLAYGTSMHALVDRASLQAGETLLVLGAAGGVGLAALTIGKALGARVIAAVGSDEKVALARQQGADAAFNYQTQDYREEVKALTNTLGPDVIFDPVGGHYTEMAFRSIAWQGRHLMVGFANGEIPALPLNLPLLKGAALVGVFWGEFARRQPQANAAHLNRLASWVVDGTLKPHVSRQYSLAEGPQALRDLLERRVKGKVVICPQKGKSG